MYHADMHSKQPCQPNMFTFLETTNNQQTMSTNVVAPDRAL